MPAGRTFAITGVVRPIRSRSPSPSGTPARRAIAIRWMIALVEQPIAIATVTAFSTAARVTMRSGVRSSHTISTMRRPQAALIRWWPASGAGIDEAPGSVRPIASAMAVIVLAVPIVMQCP